MVFLYILRLVTGIHSHVTCKDTVTSRGQKLNLSPKLMGPRLVYPSLKDYQPSSEHVRSRRDLQESPLVGAGDSVSE
jgi:hypothetical protein